MLFYRDVAAPVRFTKRHVKSITPHRLGFRISHNGGMRMHVAASGE